MLIDYQVPIYLCDNGQHIKFIYQQIENILHIVTNESYIYSKI